MSMFMFMLAVHGRMTCFVQPHGCAIRVRRMYIMLMFVTQIAWRIQYK